MDIAALDEAMMDGMIEDARNGVPGPFWCYGDSFCWPDADALALLSGEVSVEEAAVLLVSANNTLEASLRHRPRTEVVLGLLQCLAGAKFPRGEDDWKSLVPNVYYRVSAQRNSFVDNEHSRSLAHALYFACCAAAGVTSPQAEVWQAIYGSDEAREFCDAVLRPWMGWHEWHARIEPLALGVATRLVGSLGPDEKPEAFRRLEAVVSEAVNSTRFALCGHGAMLETEQGTPRSMRFAYRVHDLGGALVHAASTDRDEPASPAVEDAEATEFNAAALELKRKAQYASFGLPVPNLAEGLERPAPPPWAREHPPSER